MAILFVIVTLLLAINLILFTVVINQSCILSWAVLNVNTALPNYPYPSLTTIQSF